ncbi:MAG: serine hydroxymethyltransferase, partial [Planctomycetes bacterium]|nr:serine hydroxymethyltransferase [Planctomycetota bacterium]
MECFPGKLSSQAFHEDIFSTLRENDSRVYELITKEYERLQSTLQLIAAEGQCSRAVLAALGSVIQNKTTEGFPGSRYHGGCEIVDEVERLAAARAREAFGAKYANVQPHCGTSANLAVYMACLKPGDKIMGMELPHGGHLSHGMRLNVSGLFYETSTYGVDRETERLDMDRVRELVLEHRPALLIAGAPAYPPIIDLEAFGQIADEAGCLQLADTAH